MCFGKHNIFLLNFTNCKIKNILSQNLLIDLYKKQIWNDAKTVNVIASTCFSKLTKVLTLALQFFGGKDAEKDSDNESDTDVN